MPLIVIRGFGNIGDGTNSTLSITHGLGEAANIPIPTSVVSIDAYTVQILWDEPPNQSQAMNPGAYAIDGGVTVNDVIYITDYLYRIKTSRQTRNQLYTLTITLP